MSEPIRVVIADDSVLLREGLARLLEESGFEVAGQAGDAEDLLRKVGAHKPDVAVVDVRMPPTHTDEGLRAAHAIRNEHPGTGVLVLSQYVEEAYALELLSQSTESTGYLLKDRVADVDSFTDAVRRVAGGGSALDPEVVALLLGRRRREDPLQSITPREREVLGLMAEGRSNDAIAEALVVTERAVEKHVTSIFSKLDLTPTVEDHRRVLAVLAYLKARLSRRCGRPHSPLTGPPPFKGAAGPPCCRHDCADRCRHDRLDRRAAPNLRRGRGRSPRAAGRVDRVPRRRVHGDHGPVGLGQVHADAPARGARPARRRARSSSTGRSSPTSTTSALTALRRDKLGFVFQAFNLDPGAERAGEHHAPADARGHEGRPRRGSTRWSTPSGWATA